jgi:hypothetical protein
MSGENIMTLALQGAFVLATLLNLAVVIISVRQLIGAGRGRAQREFPTGMAVQGALLFAGSMYAMATLVGRLGDQIVDADTFLYAAVFGLSAGALTYFRPASQGRRRRSLSRALRFSAYALPVGSGLIAGLVGTV